MKKRSAELIIRWWRQPAGRHKLTVVQYDMNNFNRASFDCWFRNFDLVLACDRAWPAQRCRSLLSIKGGVICNFTPILPYFQHWGNEPRPRFCPPK